VIGPLVEASASHEGASLLDPTKTGLASHVDVLQLAPR
jgi:hypothetical protein